MSVPSTTLQFPEGHSVKEVTFETGEPCLPHLARLRCLSCWSGCLSWATGWLAE